MAQELEHHTTDSDAPVTNEENRYQNLLSEAARKHALELEAAAEYVEQMQEQLKQAQQENAALNERLTHGASEDIEEALREERTLHEGDSATIDALTSDLTSANAERGALAEKLDEATDTIASLQAQLDQRRDLPENAVELIAIATELAANSPAGFSLQEAIPTLEAIFAGSHVPGFVPPVPEAEPQELAPTPDEEDPEALLALIEATESPAPQRLYGLAYEEAAAAEPALHLPGSRPPGRPFQL